MKSLEIFIGYGVPGGSHVTGVTSLADCLAQCLSTMACHGIDYTLDEKTCWFHNHGTICLPMVSRERSVHYRLLECGQSLYIGHVNPCPADMNCLGVFFIHLNLELLTQFLASNE